LCQYIHCAETKWEGEAVGYVVPPLVAALAVSPISVALLVRQPRNRLEKAQHTLDTFARESDLALTEDVQPALVASFVERARRLRIVAIIGLPAAAAMLVLPFTVGPVAYWVYFGPLYAALLAFVPFLRPPVRWPTSSNSSLAHLRRIKVRDYIDPVIAVGVLILGTLLSAVCIALLMWPGGSSVRPRAAAVLLLLLGVGAEYVLLTRSRLRQRPRGATVQQLAFSDALMSEALGALLFSLPSVLMVSGLWLTMDSHSDALDLVGVVVPLASVSLFVTMAIRKTSAARRFKKRLYPDAPRGQVRARSAS
jgi:hypothetical protein